MAVLLSRNRATNSNDHFCDNLMPLTPHVLTRDAPCLNAVGLPRLAAVAPMR